MDGLGRIRGGRVARTVKPSSAQPVGRAVGEVLWEPSEDRKARAQLTKYAEWLRNMRGMDAQDYDALWKWSVSSLEEFWQSVWDYFDVNSHTAPKAVLSSHEMPGARWFEGATLNYAEHALRNRTPDGAALVYRSEDGRRRTLTWAETQRQVGALSESLRQLGVMNGDRVAAYVSAVPEAVIGLLASATLGATWAAVGLELAPRAAVDRLGPLSPKVLIAGDGYVYNGRANHKHHDVEEVARGMPTVKTVITVPSLGDGRDLSLRTATELPWPEAVDHDGATLSFEPVPFDHPLWILYTSGTTGVPKPIVHGHGGMVLEALKSSLHLDLVSGDRFLWYSSPSWMMWNVVANSLLTGATALFYDGSPLHDGYRVLWQIAEEEDLTTLGVSAPFLHGCMKAGVEPGESFDLRHMRELGSTAAPLSTEGFRWVFRHVKSDLWLNSASGGTDVCSGLVGGCPWLPVYAGEMQCRWLGVKAEAYDVNGRPATDGIGELVVEEPMPSMPVYFWGDTDNRWYREAYFGKFPGVWWQGDWIRFTPTGTAVIYGRSDSTIKRKGVRIGTLDIYKIVEALPEVRTSMAVEVKGRLVLFLALNPPRVFDDTLRARVTEALRSSLGPYFMPDTIVSVPDIPVTLNFKKLEIPMKKILLGWTLAQAVNMDNVLNPEALHEAVRAALPVVERFHGEV